MVGSEEQARCNPEPPALDEPVSVLKWLLGIEVQRLHTAVRIEGERDIVFPETTVIIRDVQKLMVEIERREQAPVTMVGVPDEPGGVKAYAKALKRSAMAGSVVSGEFTDGRT